jgi:hypothetical protein
MSATARDYQSPEPANTDGLDDLFEVLPTGADSVATDADSGEWITVAEAASSLKKSERSIQRYAKSGKLRSKTDESGRLLIWSATSADIFIACADNVATSADSDQALATSADSVATVADSERLWKLLKEKDAKIEALLMRNGYLQAQVETSQEAMKLLTDSQHKAGWWARFSSWFLRAQ